MNCRILEVEAQRKLSFEWVVGDMEIDTVVTFTLTHGVGHPRVARAVGLRAGPRAGLWWGALLVELLTKDA